MGILLTFLAIAASAEHRFSRMDLIQAYLYSSMSDEHLSASALPSSLPSSRIMVPVYQSMSALLMTQFSGKYLCLCSYCEQKSIVPQFSYGVRMEEKKKNGVRMEEKMLFLFNNRCKITIIFLNVCILLLSLLKKTTLDFNLHQGSVYSSVVLFQSWVTSPGNENDL